MGSKWSVWKSINEIDIILTSAGCGVGKMSCEDSFNQTIQAINDYMTFECVQINSHVILAEPNLLAQPKIYMNTEWFDII